MVDLNFFDSLIYLSLIITFALILLLVYYFKQRISALEQRSDSLFDIINSLVKQMQLMQAAPQYLGEKSTPENASIRAYDNVAYAPQYIASAPVSENIYLENAEDDDSLGDSSEEDEKTDSESDEESDSESDSHLESESEDESIPQAETKIIHVDLPETNLNDLPSSSADENESLGDDEIQIPEDIVLDTTEIPIIVNKLELDTTENISELGDEHDNGSTIEHYKKWALPALRTLVISKGLVSDASKMKKNELLKLLSEEQP